MAWLVPYALAKEGYILIIVADGRQALWVLERELPDLILSDLRLPRMDGWALFQEVQERYPQVPFIAMSGHSDSAKATGKGFDAYIQKPFDIRYLIITVRRIICEAKRLYLYQALLRQFIYLSSPPQDTSLVGKKRRTLWLIS